MRNFIRSVLISLLLLIVLFCGYKVYTTQLEYKKAQKEYEELLKFYTELNAYKAEKTANSQEESTEQKDGENLPDTEEDEESIQEIDYDFSKTIDFDSLLSLNSDIVGWITIPDTTIDYPIVKSSDNNDYLHLTFLKEYNSSGSIFLDMRNSADLTDYNSLIYGHNMKNGSMFTHLKDYKQETFYKGHSVVEIYQPGKSSVYKIISCYSTVKTGDGYRVDFDNVEEYENWLKEIASRSQYAVEGYDVNKPTITLSTCNGASGTEQRWVVHIQKLY